MMKGFNRFFLLALLFSALAACGGGGNDGYGSGSGGGGNSGSDTGTVPAPGSIESIIISKNYEEGLFDDKNGTYTSKYSLSVTTDKSGTPAPDGTRIDLKVIDTVLAQGSISGAPDGISGTTLDIPNASMADGTAITDLSTVFVTRGGVNTGAKRYILEGDQVILTGPVADNDIIRSLAAAPVSGTTTLTTSTTYDSSYPVYNATDYIVGASMTGVRINGLVGDNTPAGYTLVQGGQGEALVLVTYPSNEDYLNLGCVPPSIDQRVTPAGASRPIFVASSGGVSNFKDFCFAPEAGYQITATPEAISVATDNATTPGYVWICAADGGDKLRNIPYASFFATVGGDAAIHTIARPFDIAVTAALPTNRPPDSYSTPVANGQYFTHAYGCAYIEIVADANAVSSTTGTVTVSFGGTEKIDIPLTIQ